MKIIFRVLLIVGIVIIGTLSFYLPSNPYQIVPALTVMSLDKPLWFCYFVLGSCFYIVFLFYFCKKNIKNR